MSAGAGITVPSIRMFFLGFTLGNMWVGMWIVYLSCVTNV